MTLQEYLNQEDPKRLSAGSVEITEADIAHSWDQNMGPSRRRYSLPSGRVIELHFPNINFRGTYFLHDGSTILYTMDDHGNPDRMSVFKLKQEPK